MNAAQAVATVPSKDYISISTVQQRSRVFMGTDQCRRIEIQEQGAAQECEPSGNTGREALRHAVGAAQEQGDKYATNRLQDDDRPHNPVVSSKESSLSDMFAVREEYS